MFPSKKSQSNIIWKPFDTNKVAWCRLIGFYCNILYTEIVKFQPSQNYVQINRNKRNRSIGICQLKIHFDVTWMEFIDKCIQYSRKSVMNVSSHFAFSQQFNKDDSLIWNLFNVPNNNNNFKSKRQIWFLNGKIFLLSWNSIAHTICQYKCKCKANQGKFKAITTKHASSTRS